jgi:hypothetical protein
MKSENSGSRVSGVNAKLVASASNDELSQAHNSLEQRGNVVNSARYDWGCTGRCTRAAGGGGGAVVSARDSRLGCGVVCRGRGRRWGLGMLRRRGRAAPIPVEIRS